MRLTTKGRYAVMALLDIAIHQQQGICSITHLAQRQSLSVAYLERIAGKLRAHGLLKSIRGAKGGYLLAKPAETITIAEIMHAVDEQLDTTRCAGKADCQGGATCLAHHLWTAINLQMTQFLQGVTLGMLATNPDILLIANKQKAQTHHSKLRICSNESISAL